MEQNNPNVTSLLGVVTGICTHVLLYRVGEWDLMAPTLLLVYTSLGLVFFGVEWFSFPEFFGVYLPGGWALKLVIGHIGGVYASIIIYRAFLHRLNKFPGPFFARISNLYVTYLSAKNLHLYQETERLHKKYGDYVRLGPTEISIVDPQAIPALFGPQAQVAKGPWYNVLQPRVSLQMERDKKEHARRRKAWDQGFGSKALRGYESRVSKYTYQLIDVIENHIGTELNMSRWFNYYSFDVMGDLSFGKSFNMLINGEDTYFLTALHADMKNIGLFSHLTWLFPFFKLTPGLNRQYLKFWSWLHDQVRERMNNEPEIPDVFSWILKDYYNGPKTQQTHLNLHGDSYLIVVAGSDTTAATLTNLFYHLAVDTNLMKQLQTELDRLENLSHKNLVELGLLDGIINETLRLHPAVPSGTQRVTPPEGLKVGDTYIPGNVIVQSPVHTVFRDERNFVRPTEFLPTRWTSEPHLIKDRSVFIPFNAGHYSCAGKQLALMELRFVTAELLKRYDVILAPGQTKEAFLAGMRDTFTLVTPPLQLIFERRKTV